MKIAELEDAPIIKEMGLEFLKNSGYSDLGDPSSIDDLIKQFIESPRNERIIILEEDVGFIAGHSTPFIFNPNLRLAAEVAWWINEDKRGEGAGMKLKQAFEYWAKNVAGCQLITMTSLDKKVESFYKKSGYKLYERAYMKVL